uniref:CD74 molecule n=1 Tax=Anas platyrhynchos platyrhynchos TaxID=8840 RepID=U3J8L0_ANAPP
MGGGRGEAPGPALPPKAGDSEGLVVPGGVGIALGPPGARGLKRGGPSEGLCPAPHTAPPSAGSKSAGNMKMSMVNTPLAMRVLPLAPSLDDTPVKDMGPPSNKTEDQVRHLLLQADPKKMFPELKDSLLGNLKSLKKTMTDADWKSFESWMHKWLLFEMAKSPKPDERKAIPAEKVQTKCQAEANFGGVHPGRFRPECDENGDYLPKQCHAGTGYCWCCYKNGTKIEGTATRGELDCSGAALTEPDEMIFSGVDMLKLGAEKAK